MKLDSKVEPSGLEIEKEKLENFTYLSIICISLSLLWNQWSVNDRVDVLEV